MHLMVSAWGGRERPRLKHQQHKAQPNCSVLWRTYVRDYGGRHADAWRTDWGAALGGSEVSGSGHGTGRLTVAIDVAEALHHSAQLRAWPEMNAAPRGQTTDRRSREH